MQVILELEEIRLLSRLHNQPISIMEDYQEILEKLLANNLLCYSDYQYELRKLAVAELKKIAASNGLSQRGKKAELISSILSSVPAEKLKTLPMQKYFVLTEQGEQMLKDNSALLIWHSGLRHEYVTAANVIDVQNSHKNMSANDILLLAYQNRLEICSTDSERFGLLLDIKKIYQWKKDEHNVEKVSAEIAEIDKRLNEAWKEKYESIDFDKVLGLTKDERKAIRDEALAELDDEWEKEVDAKYRAMVENKQQKF